MATGVPCIAGDAGGLREIVRNGETGILVRPDDPDALAFAVKTLLRDRAMAARLAQAAKERVAREYSWDDIAEEPLRVYREALGTVHAGVGKIVAQARE
jgi:glycosyltransferase involved in cell wall biosynthesis